MKTQIKKRSHRGRRLAGYKTDILIKSETFSIIGKGALDDSAGFASC